MIENVEIDSCKRNDLFERDDIKIDKQKKSIFPGVQVVGRHYQEEMVLHALEIIESMVNYHNQTGYV